MNNLTQGIVRDFKVDSFDSPAIDRPTYNPNPECSGEKRLYGLDPGCFDPRDIESMGDADFWLAIYGHGGIVQQLNQPRCYGKELHDNITEHVFAIEFLTYHFCKKSGIAISEPLSFRHIEAGPEYRKWQGFYHRHFREVLSPDEFSELQEIRKAKGDISKFLPEGTWRD